MPDQRSHRAIHEAWMDVPDIPFHEAEDIAGELMDRLPQVLALARSMSLEGQDVRRQPAVRPTPDRADDPVTS